MGGKNGSGTPADGRETVGPTLSGLRKTRRLTGIQLGRMAGLSQPTISRLERDIGLPDPENVRRVAEALGADADVVSHLVSVAERAHDLMTDLRPGPGSLAERQRVFGEEESTAREIRVFQADLVIGLLQSSDYARAILSGFQQLQGNQPTAKPVEEAVSKRISRQVILTDPEKSFQFILGEAALTNRLCPPEFMPAQIQRIRDVAKQDNVVLSIIPADAVWPIAPLHGFTLLDENAVLIDLFNTATSSRGKSDNRAYRYIFDLYAAAATTEIEPILDRSLNHYLNILQPDAPRYCSLCISKRWRRPLFTPYSRFMSDYKGLQPPAAQTNDREHMMLTAIASCGSGSCPTIYRTPYGTLVIQGRAVPPEQTDVELAPGELLVEIPESLLAHLPQTARP